MKESVIKAMNDQINAEMYSGYLYLAMSLSMHEANFKGFSNWLFKQYKEEFEHAEDFIDFLQRRDVEVALAAISSKEMDEKDPLKIAEAVLEHERTVTAAIYRLHDLAKAENDYASEIFLHKYISEQIQEEDSAQDIIDKFTFAGESTAARYAVDCELGRR